MGKSHSMTGFGKGEETGTNYNLTVEIKSVNHRFKDYRFRLPNIFSSVEVKLRKLMDKNFSRGSFDISASYRKLSEAKTFDQIDIEKVKNFVSMFKDVSDSQKVDLGIRPVDFLRYEFQLEDDDKEKELIDLLIPAAQKAMDDLKKARAEEGENLIDVLQKHRKDYEFQLEIVKKHADEYEQIVKERVLKKLEEFNIRPEENDSRFYQEVIYYLEKLDIHEEMNRIGVHLQKLDNILQSDGELGRQLDFVVQEL
ncbi:MAG: YicC family protein, partial [Bacteriovoracia bacterium]